MGKRKRRDGDACDIIRVICNIIAVVCSMTSCVALPNCPNEVSVASGRFCTVFSAQRLQITITDIIRGNYHIIWYIFVLVL